MSVADERLCSRCGKEPRVGGQRWGKACRNASKRDHRHAERASGGAANRPNEPDTAALPTTTEGKGETRAPAPAREKASGPASAALTNVGTPRPVFVPFAGTGATPSEPWHVAFLAHLAENGGLHLAAAHVGISRATLNRAREADPLFADEAESAKAFYRELVEWESVNLARTKNNPLPFFARLKAEMPERYLDKAINVNLNAELGGNISATDVRRLLSDTLANCTDEARRQIAAEGQVLTIAPATAEAAPGGGTD